MHRLKGAALARRYLWTSAFIFILISFAFEAETATKTEFPVPKPPFSKGIFPCSDCHGGMEVNAKKRVLAEAHTDIKLHHAESVRWCLDCHDAANRDKLRLVNGDPLDFTESYILCGQCHGPTYRDWRNGVHGKRTGYFSGGTVMYYLCVNCHNPHDPKFKPIKPEPPPFRPLSEKNVIR